LVKLFVELNRSLSPGFWTAAERYESQLSRRREQFGKSKCGVPSGMGVIQRTLRHFDHLFPL
jgi:hypothetical protein